jgi:amino acid transporter
VVGTALSAVMCMGVALCFVELGGMYDRNGGAYVYARHAFGPYVAYAVAWLGVTQGVLSFSAVARGFADQLSTLAPGLKLGAEWARLGAFALTGKGAVAVLLGVGLGAINYVGVKAGARTSTVLSLAKLLPLVLLAALGALHIRAELLAEVLSASSLPPQAGGRYIPAVGASAFLAVFMMSGFEYVAVPAGETREAKRNVPLAIVVSLLGSALLYCLLQLACFSLLPDVARSEQPLPDLALRLLGPSGEGLLGLAGLVSMAGFCAGSALVGPRYLSTLAEDGYLPAPLERLSRFGTPGVAIGVATVLSSALSLVLGYASLVDAATISILAQYVPVCLAPLVLRYRAPSAPRLYRLPGGPLIPAAATLSMLALVYTAPGKREEWVFTGQLLLLGGLVWGLTALLRRRAPSLPRTS